MAASERPMRKIGLIADSVWATLVDGLRRVPLRTDLESARNAALQKSQVWARRHADGTSELLTTSPAERAWQAEAARFKAWRIAWTSGLQCFPRQQRRRSIES